MSYNSLHQPISSTQVKTSRNRSDNPHVYPIMMWWARKPWGSELF